MDGERDWLGHFIEPGEKQRLVDIAAVVGALG